MSSMQEYPIASIKDEDVQKIVQVEDGITAASGKKIILIAYENQ